MSTDKSNKNVLFYKKWNEETAKAYLKKIFDYYDANKDGTLERSEVNDWRKKTTHPKEYRPFDSDDEWKEYLKVSFGVDLGTEAKVTFDQLFAIYKAQDSKAAYLGGNTLFTDLWHMLDQGVISDPSLVPHVVIKSKCSRCGQNKRLIDYRGVAADVRGQGGQWLKPDTDRVCIDCESEQNYKTITRSFELNGVAFVYKYLWTQPPSEKKENTRLYVDGALVGRIEYREEGANYVAKTFFDQKPVKSVSYFALDDPVPREKFVEESTKQEARAYFASLAKRTGTSVNDLALILSDLFLFPNPYQVSDIFALDA
jgi:hypothetical protein